jgi:hypothetical protein
MNDSFEYYYNNVPGIGLCRNNLIYTSLINKDKTIFVQWYHNDSEYHKGQNEVVDPVLMNNKWQRELRYITLMNDFYPQHIPKIIDINHGEQKLFLEVNGPDFWEQAGCDQNNFDSILPDWQDQMFEIIKAHHSLGLFKYSMHPSSYFVVDGKLKTINYFFAYADSEGPISIADHTSHIYSTRQQEMKKATDAMGISWTDPQPLSLLEDLCWESFRKNYPSDFIERAKCIK